MSKYTKSLVAIAVAVLISGPASAVDDDDVIYSGSKAEVSFSGSGCKTDKAKDQSMSIRMTPNIELVGNDVIDTGQDTGYWFSAFFDFGDIENTGNGFFIISKPGKLVVDAPRKATMDLSRNTFIEIKDSMGVHAALYCNNFVEYLEDSTQIKKFEATWSKNGERLKVKLVVESNYRNERGFFKKLKWKVNSKQLERGVIDK